MGVVQNQVAQTNQNNKSMSEWVKAYQGEIAKALPSVLTPERFSRMVLSALSATPQLQACTPKSFLGAMMQAAQLGLEPNNPSLGLCYLIPRKNKGIDECTFQLGYRGMIDLAYRSGEVSMIQSHIVYENDKFEYEFGLEPKLTHVPAKSNRGSMTFCYAMFKTKNGGSGFDVMSIDEIRDFAKKYSVSYSSSYSPWNTNFEEMAKKTVLKKVLKYAPLKSEFVKAMSADESVKNTLDEDMFNVSNEIAYEADYEEVKDNGTESK